MVKKNKVKLNRKLFPFLIGILLLAIPFTYFILKSPISKIVNPAPTTIDGIFTFDIGYGTEIKAIPSGIYNVTGTLTGGTWANDEMCISGSCLYFNGINTKIDFGDNNYYDYSPFTISFWFRHEPMVSGTQVIVAKQNASAGYKIQMESDGDLTFAIDDDGTSFPEDSVTTTEANYDDNRWHHFAAIKTGSTTLEIVIDGKLVATQAIATATGAIANSANLYIGSDGDGASNFYKGYIDEFKFYTNTVKTTETIKSDTLKAKSVDGLSASFGDTKYYLSDGLAGHWKMDEASGNGIDSSGVGTLLTDNNTVTRTTGKFGNAGNFEKDNSEYLSATDNASLSITGDLTISAWINPESTTADTEFTIAGKWDVTNQSYQLVQYGDEIRFYVDSSSNYVTTTASNLTAGTWYQIIGIYNALGQTAKIYINGIEQTTSITGTIPSSIADDTSPFNIAYAITGSHYDGIIDDVRVYNKTLSPGEIKAMSIYSPGPVGWWKMDENSGSTAYDSSGNGYSGTLSPVGTSWTKGKYGSGVNFSGDLDATSTDYIRIDDNDAFSINTTNQLTIEGWVKLNVLNKNQFLVSKRYYVGPSYEYNLSIYNTNIFECAINQADGSLYLQAISTITATTNTWYHVACVIDNTIPSAKLYVDGILVGTDVTPSGSIANGTAPLQIGSDRNGDNHLGGIADDVKIYNYVRTPTQIVQDMNANHPAPGSPVGSAAAYWDFEEGYLTTAHDSSINQLDLTLSSASWTTSGKFGKAFNGGNNLSLSISDTPALEPGANEDFTISAWFKSDGADTAATEYLVSKMSSSAGYQIYFDTNGYVTCGIDDDSTGFPEDSATTTTDYYDTTWHQVICVRDITANKLLLYVDGKLTAQDSSLTATGSLAGDNITFYLGDANGTDGTDEFLGDIDDTKFYRFALTAEQVKTEYNQGKTIVFGSNNVNSSGMPSNSSAEAYCVPGDSTACTPPVAEWKFDENKGVTANDTATNANTGTLTNGPAWVPGKFGTAINFDGANAADDYINTGQGTTIANIFDGGGSISGWFYARSDGEGDLGRIIAKNARWYVATNNQSGNNIRVVFEQYFPSGAAYWTTPYVSINTWHHFAITYDNSSTTNDPIIYIDGISVTLTETNTASGTRIDDASTDLVLGNASTSADRTFDGYLDNIKIYDYTRTLPQIAWDYNKGAPIAQYDFDECSGTTLNDTAPKPDKNSTKYSGTIDPGDTSGDNDSVGTCLGGTTEMWGEGSSGKYSSSLGFDGTNDYVNLGTGNVYGAMGSENTVAAWIKTTNSNFQAIVGQYEGGVCGSVVFRVNSADTITRGNGSGGSVVGQVPVTDGNWHHVVATVSSTATNIYVDGELDTTGITLAATSSCTTQWRIGAEQNAGAMYLPFNGQIDDVRIYKYPLTAIQVKNLYNKNSAVQFAQ